MVNCPYCGKEIAENERYCWHCESDLSEIVDKPEREQHEALKQSVKDLIKPIKQLVKKSKKKQK